MKELAPNIDYQTVNTLRNSKEALVFKSKHVSAPTHLLLLC